MAQWAGDGGRKLTGYDVFGDVRKRVDELGHVVLETTNALGHLTRVERLGIDRVDNQSGSNWVAPTLVDTYDVDALGRRVGHVDALGNVTKTTYDSLSRVIGQMSAEGRWVRYDYRYVAAGSAVEPILGLGGQNVGGYRKTTVQADSRTLVDAIDHFDRVTWHRDLGGNTYDYTYDLGGRLARQTSSAGQRIEYSHFANGYVKEAKDLTERTLSRFGYDNAGNRTSELYAQLDDSGNGIGLVYQQTEILHDELNRMSRVKDGAFDVQYDYDAVGNRRAVHAVYWDRMTLATLRQDHLWYAYDQANRFTISKGSFAGTFGTSATDNRGGIVIDREGVELTYDAAGQRKSARSWSQALGQYAVDTYSYSADGYLEDVRIGSDGQVPGRLQARRSVDALGRTHRYQEWDSAGSLRQTRTSIYDLDGRILAETVGGAGAPDGTSTYRYYSDSSDNAAAASQTGSGQLARVDFDPAANGAPNDVTTYTYGYWDSAKQKTIRKNGQDAEGLSNFHYDTNGYLRAAVDTRGGRTFSYFNNANGQLLRRNERMQATGQMHDHFWYYAQGVRVGDVSTDPSDNVRVSYAEQLAVALKDVPSTRDRFRNFKPVSSADFDQNYEPINARYPAATGSLYSVQAGETLKSIARTVWGDQAMWYLIAEANDLSASSVLSVGQQLRIPNKVANVHNNAETFRPYNPGEVIGSVDPTLPMPAGNKGCGAVGTIIMVVVAIVVAYFTAGAAFTALGGSYGAGGTAAFTALGGSYGAGGTVALTATNVTAAVGSGVIGGAAGAAASQAVGVAIGAVDKFNWKAVAQGAIAGGVTAGVGVSGFGENVATALGGGKYVTAAANATAGTSITMAMQGRWDWKGIAASAVGAAAGVGAAQAVSFAFGRSVSPSFSAFALRLATESASGWAAYAINPIGSARDSVVAALGNALGEGIADLTSPTVQASSVNGYQSGFDAEDLHTRQNQVPSRELAFGRGLSDSATASEVMAYRMREAGYEGEMTSATFLFNLEGEGNTSLQRQAFRRAEIEEMNANSGPEAAQRHLEAIDEVLRETRGRGPTRAAIYADLAVGSFRDFGANGRLVVLAAIDNYANALTSSPMSGPGTEAARADAAVRIAADYARSTDARLDHWLPAAQNRQSFDSTSAVMGAAIIKLRNRASDQTQNLATGPYDGPSSPVEGKSTPHAYPDGSVRTADGKFASISGQPPPGTVNAARFAEHLRSNGVHVVGTELEVLGPLGIRKYDVVTRNLDGTLHGMEIKTGGATPNSYQDFTDRFVGQFGAVGRGRIAGRVVTNTSTVYLPPRGF